MMVSVLSIMNDVPFESFVPSTTGCCPLCQRSFRDFERMADGVCEICNEEEAAAFELFDSFDDEILEIAVPSSDMIYFA